MTIVEITSALSAASALAKGSGAMRTASAKDCHGLRGVSGARQRSGGVEKYSSIASRQAPEHGSTREPFGAGLEDQRRSSRRS
jgi:hypothetical protein